jgi:hypothetical protein
MCHTKELWQTLPRQKKRRKSLLRQTLLSMQLTAQCNSSRHPRCSTRCSTPRMILIDPTGSASSMTCWASSLSTFVEAEPHEF